MLKYLELVREWFGKVKVFRGKNVSEKKKRKKREKKRKEKERERRRCRWACYTFGVLYFFLWGGRLNCLDVLYFFCGLEVELLGGAILFWWGEGEC